MCMELASLLSQVDCFAIHAFWRKLTIKISSTQFHSLYVEYFHASTKKPQIRKYYLSSNYQTNSKNASFLAQQLHIK